MGEAIGVLVAAVALLLTGMLVLSAMGGYVPPWLPIATRGPGAGGSRSAGRANTNRSPRAHQDRAGRGVRRRRA